MKERKSTTIKKTKVLVAYQKNAGNVRLSCLNANVGKTQFYEWKKNDPIFNTQVEKILKTVIKCGEDKILAKAIEGDVEAWKKKVLMANQALSKLIKS